MKRKAGNKESKPKSSSEPPEGAAVMNSISPPHTPPAIDDVTGLARRSGERRVYKGEYIGLRCAAGVVLGPGVSAQEAAAYARDAEKH